MEDVSQHTLHISICSFLYFPVKTGVILGISNIHYFIHYI